MGTKTTSAHAPQVRAGDYGLGIPRSRVKDASALNDEEVGGARSRDDEQSRRQSPQGREGDYGLGIPRSRTKSARTLSDEEIEDTRRAEDEELRRQFEESVRRLEEANGSYELPAGVRRALIWTGCALVSVLGLVLVAQSAAVVASIGSLPVPFDWIVTTLAVVFAGTLSWVILQLALMLVRLQRNPSVDLHAIRTLQERRHMQDLATKHAERAQSELRSYLEKYPLDNAARGRLIVLGLTEGECDDLASAKRFLLADDEPMPPDEWLASFRRRFQSILDRAAENRTKGYTTKVGVGTALSPVAMIDKAVVLYACMALIKELAFLYGLRPALGQSVAILARSILQAHLAGLLQDASEAAADTLWSEVSESVGEASVGEMTTRISSFIPQVGVKVTEGAVNALLISRLGKRAMSLLQPVRPAD